MIETGYWAYAKDTSKSSRRLSTKVHLAENGKALCGVRSSGFWQWCSHGIRYEYLECKNCKRIAMSEKL